MGLEESIHREIDALCAEGDALVRSGDDRGALRHFHRAWNMLPEPKEDWEGATWILSAIGDVHFTLRDFEKGMAAFANAVHCPGGLGNPFIHLRLGEAAFELGKMDRATDELTRAYLGAGRDLFADEDPKYLAFLETILRPMPGDDRL